MEKDIVKSISVYWYNKCWQLYRDGAAGIYISANGQGAKHEARGCQQLREEMGLAGCISGEGLPWWGIKIHTWRQLPFLISFSRLYGLQRFTLERYRCAGTKNKAQPLRSPHSVRCRSSTSVSLRSGPAPTAHPLAAGCSSSEGAP